MAGREDGFWYGLGRGVGTAISSLPGNTTPAPSGRSRVPRPGVSAHRRRTDDSEAISGLLAAAGSTAIVSLLQRWSKAHRPTLGALAKGAVAGAAAAGATLVFRWYVPEREEGIEPSGWDGVRSYSSEVLDELLAGAGRGLIYSALLSPYLPGPPIFRGAVVGTMDYLAAPIGGLFARLQEFSPVRRLPVVSVLFETGDAEDDPFLAFLAQGALMGLIYGDE